MEKEIFEKSDDKWTAFICRHGDGPASLANELRKEVNARLDTEGFHVTDANFLSVVVMSLEHEFRANIASIYADQWMMVTAVTEAGDFTVQVECDDAEDGIAAVWKAFADRAAG